MKMSGWKIICKMMQGRRKLFLVGGGGVVTLKFRGPSRALQELGFIGEIF